VDRLELFLGRLDLFLLLFSRWTGLLATAPVFSHRLIPVQVRVALAVVFSLIALPLFAGEPALAFPGGLALAVIRELLTGMLVGFVASLLFSAIAFAGELLDIDLGFAVVNVLDPLSSQPVPMLGSLLQILALLFYLGVDGHHSLLLALLESYQAVPIAGLSPGPDFTQHLVRAAGEIFRAGFLLASPVLAALFLATVALALVGRAVPQMNLFIVGLPAKTGAGLLLLALLIPVYTTAFAGLFDQIHRQVLDSLPLMAPGP